LTEHCQQIHGRGDFENPVAFLANRWREVNRKASSGLGERVLMRFKLGYPKM
jgi:hypothetical protein